MLKAVIMLMLPNLEVTFLSSNIIELNDRSYIVINHNFLISTISKDATKIHYKDKARHG